MTFLRLDIHVFRDHLYIDSLYYESQELHFFTVESDKSEKAECIIYEAERAVEQTRIPDRIYEALKLWKEKCYKEDNHVMCRILTRSFQRHKQEISRLYPS